MDHFDIAVAGAGLAGSLAALALAAKGRRVALIAPQPGAADGRTTALMDHSLDLVKKLDLWHALAPLSAPLSSLRIVDATGRLLRSPTITFHAAEIGLSAFGYNIPNAPFLELLSMRMADEATLTRIAASISDVTLKADAVAMTLDNGQTLSASLAIGADGKRSKLREALGIAARTWSYPQTALVLTFSHQRPHQDISTEFHTRSGPFTQVPLPGNRSSLVWVLQPDEAAAMLALSNETLADAVEQRMGSMLGKVAIETPAQSFPLSGMAAETLGKGRAALIGEAAHAFPPIGAQGLNLSLRDIMAAVTLIGSGEIPDDVGDRYDRTRRADTLSRTVGVDLLNRSLLSDFLPVQFLRAGGLQALASISPLRNFIMREGLGASRHSPGLS